MGTVEAAPLPLMKVSALGGKARIRHDRDPISKSDTELLMALADNEKEIDQKQEDALIDCFTQRNNENS